MKKFFIDHLINFNTDTEWKIKMICHNQTPKYTTECRRESQSLHFHFR